MNIFIINHNYKKCNTNKITKNQMILSDKITLLRISNSECRIQSDSECKAYWINLFNRTRISILVVLVFSNFKMQRYQLCNTGIFNLKTIFNRFYNHLVIILIFLFSGFDYL